MQDLRGVETEKTLDLWCADYTEDGSGEVATIEVPGEFSTQSETDAAGTRTSLSDPSLVIAPGCRAPTEDDGQMIARGAQDPNQVYYNAAILPGWQRHIHPWRVGTIDSIDSSANTCALTLDQERSSANGLVVGDIEELEDVAIQYMTCNAAAFDVGDRVIVDMSGPTVVGFEAGPRSCSSLYAHLQFLASGQFIVTGASAKATDTIRAGHGKWRSTSRSLTWLGSEVFWDGEAKATIPDELAVAAAAIDENDLVVLSSERVLRGKRVLVLFRASLDDLTVWSRTDCITIGDHMEFRSDFYDYIDANFSEDGKRVIGVAANEKSWEEFELSSTGGTLSAPGARASDWAITSQNITDSAYTDLPRSSQQTIAVDYLFGTHTPTRLVIDLNTPSDSGLDLTLQGEIESSLVPEGASRQVSHSHDVEVTAESVGSLRVTTGSSLTGVTIHPAQSVAMQIRVEFLGSLSYVSGMAVYHATQESTVNQVDIVGLDLSRGVVVLAERTISIPAEDFEIPGTVEYSDGDTSSQFFVPDDSAGVVCDATESLMHYGQTESQELASRTYQVQMLCPSDFVRCWMAGQRPKSRVTALDGFPFVSGFYLRPERFRRAGLWSSSLRANVSTQGGTTSVLDYMSPVWTASDSSRWLHTPQPAQVIRFDGDETSTVDLGVSTVPTEADGSYASHS